MLRPRMKITQLISIGASAVAVFAFADRGVSVKVCRKPMAHSSWIAAGEFLKGIIHKGMVKI